MAKPWKPDKKSVALDQQPRPSRIRRDPVHVKQDSAEAEKKLQWESGERDIWIAVIGIIAFALAIDIIVMAIGAYWS